MHPVYVKGDQEQVAPTPLDEVRLKFNGWRLKGAPVKAPAQPAPADPAEQAGSGEPAADESAENPKPRRRSAPTTTE
jgi:hypothetical protein